MCVCAYMHIYIQGGGTAAVLEMTQERQAVHMKISRSSGIGPMLSPNCPGDRRGVQSCEKSESLVTRY